MAKLSKFILNSLVLASVSAQEVSTFQVVSCNSDVSKKNVKSQPDQFNGQSGSGPCIHAAPGQ